MELSTGDIINFIKKGALGANEKDFIYNISSQHPADQASLIEDLLQEDAKQEIKYISAYLNPEFLAYLDFGVDAVTEILGHEKVAVLLQELDISDIFDVLEHLDKQDVDLIVTLFPLKLQKRIKDTLSYPEESVGRIMNSQFVAVPYWFNAGQVLERVKQSSKIRDKNTEYDGANVVIVNEKNTPLGFLGISDILNLKAEDSIEDIYEKNTKTIQSQASQDELIALFNQYDFSVIAVVNKFDKIIGIIEASEIADLLARSSEKKALWAMGIFSNEGDRVLKATFYRSIWIFCNLFTAGLAASVVSLFEHDFSHITTLAVLMPIVASIGGNGGMQALTVMIRGLAIGNIKKGRYLRNIVYEICIAVLSAFIFGFVCFLGAFLWFDNLKLALVFGLSVFLILFIGGLAGANIPVVFKFLRLDPAIGSSIFLTAITDISGFFIFLFLSHIFLI